MGIIGTVLAVVVFAVVLLGSLKVTGYAFFPENVGRQEKTGYGVRNEETLSKLELLQDYIDYYFLYDPDPEAVADSLYNGLLDSLDDPYSVYYDRKAYQSFKESSSGQYYGIGVAVVQDQTTNAISIDQVYRNSPAAEAGILQGDVLKGVEGEDVSYWTLDDVVEKVRGEAGTFVNLTIYRPDTDETLELQVERRQITQDTVWYEMLEDQIGYIILAEFDTVSPAQMQEALDSLYADGMQALVLDLRGNPGGDLDSLVEIGNLFLPEGNILTIDYRASGVEEYKSKGEHEIQIPMAVLVDGNTASAAEVLTGAIKDYEKGTIIGTQTFGKGIVQTIFPLGDGTAIKLTVADYYTPAGNNIHKVGIEPDLIVEYDPEAEEDNQLEAALAHLREALGLTMQPAA